MSAVRVCALSDLAVDSATRFDVEGHRLSVIRIGDDVYVIGDTCTHQEISLSEGELEPDAATLECWKHGSLFDVKTGEPLSLPATKPTPVYEVRVEGDDVFVTLPEAC